MDWMKFPPVSALRAFAALAQAGSASGGGALLNVSHAAISQQVKNLEERLGVSLVDRRKRQLRLTAEGDRLAQVVLAGFGDIEQVVSELVGENDDRPVQVSLTPMFAAHWLMPRLADFRTKFPQSDILLDPNPHLIEFTPGGVDVGVRYGSGQWPGLKSQLLVESSMVIVASPDLVGTRDYADPRDLAHFPWLQELGTTEASDWLRKHGATQLKDAGWTQLPGNLVLEGILSGQGIAVTARNFVEADLSTGKLRLLFEVGDKKGYHLVSRSGVQRPAVRRFCRWLLAQAGKI